MFGGLYLGIWLPLSAASQATWDVSPDGSTSGDYEPGSWGGHAVYMPGYASKTVTIATWGARVRATWEFLHEYCDEAYCVISEDFLYRTGKTPQGFNIDALTEALTSLE
jgi:hypothetical protein